LTSGDWEVTGFHGLDLDARRLLVSGTYDGSLDRHLYEITWEGDAVPADTVRIRRLTPEDGWHNPSVSGTMRYFADTFSSLSEPPSTVIRNARGITLHTLVSNAALKEALTEFGLPALTLERVPATDGTPLDGWFIRPSDFDTSGTYPLLLYVYGGPGSQQVRNSWYSGRPDRHLWHAWLADQLGIVVGCVDNRGAAGRGGEFKWLPYRNLGYYEAQDQIAVARYLSKKPFIDEDRVGIWGWSYGGYMTLMSMLTHDGPSTFSVGVSVAPVTSWRLYDTIYTERYMGTPAGNPDGYARSEPLAYASRLRDEQRLLLIHGDLDDNVHVQNTVQMAERLQTEGRQFSLMLYPGAEHSLREKYQKLHVFTLITDFLKENLGSRDGRPSGP